MGGFSCSLRIVCRTLRDEKLTKIFELGTEDGIGVEAMQEESDRFWVDLDERWASMW
jgi:hypothetical protein